MTEDFDKARLRYLEREVSTLRRTLAAREDVEAKLELHCEKLNGLAMEQKEMHERTLAELNELKRKFGV